jgi:hypothetical protein
MWHALSPSDARTLKRWIAAELERDAAQVGRNAKRGDAQRLRPKDEHAVGGEADDAPNPNPTSPEGGS